MHRFLFIIGLLVCLPVQAQTPFDTYQAFRDSLTTLSLIADPAERTSALDTFWDSLRVYNQIPYKQGTQAAFLYRSGSSNIRFAGDFNRWNPSDGVAERLGDSDVWILEEAFPDDARLDYKIVVNNTQWILDPENPLTQRGGFGDNSELRMPNYIPSPWVESQPGVPKGALRPTRHIASTSLGYTVNYRVYVPDGYDAQQLSDLPVIYVTDGHEYADDLMGSMPIVLDNLIFQALIEPVLAVFIDPRVNGDNLRGQQYVENPLFADFVADELVPEVDQLFRTRPNREARAILGTSLGGLNAAYFGAVKPETFKLIGIQSPAFHAGSTIFDLYENEPVRDLQIHMAWGTIFDIGDAGDQMASILTDKGYDFDTVVKNEGHSWGLWRSVLDEVLISFWAPPATGIATEDPKPVDKTELSPNYPNPFNASTTIPFVLHRSGHVQLTVHDVLGRRVANLVKGHYEAGTHSVTWAPSALQPSGIYFYRLHMDGQPVSSRTLMLVR